MATLRNPVFINPQRVESPGFKGGLSPFNARRTLSYIDSNLSRRIPVEDLADGVGLSQSHFCRVFRQTFGVPPVVYVARRRVQRAQQLMQTSTVPLVSIALECGLSDQSHLTKIFRRVTGVSPSAWRRSAVGPDAGSICGASLRIDNGFGI
jgi:AraC family transcriptional regulator